MRANEIETKNTLNEMGFHNAICSIRISLEILFVKKIFTSNELSFDLIIDSKDVAVKRKSHVSFLKSYHA